MAKIRLSSSYVFLTYPKCGIPLDDIRNQLQLKFQTLGSKMVSYIICHELHEDGEPHRHCWVKLTRAVERVGPRALDLEYEGVTYHGDYENQKYSNKCAKYCVKDGDFITSFSKDELEQIIKSADQPKKLDKGFISRELMNGRPLVDILTSFPALLFEYKKLKENISCYKSDLNATRTLDKLENEWIWGETGAGKSRSVREKYPGAFIKNKEEFWDTYQQEDVVILEDVDESWATVLHQLKIWADHYPFNAKIKHMPPIKIRPSKIIVTSNYTIAEVFAKVFISTNSNYDGTLIKAVERRFKEIKIEVPAKLPEVFNDDYWANIEEEADKMLSLHSQKVNNLCDLIMDDENLFDIKYK